MDDLNVWKEMKEFKYMFCSKMCNDFANIKEHYQNSKKNADSSSKTFQCS